MKTLITSLVLGIAALAPMAHADIYLPEFPTTWPQDGVFDGEGRILIVVKDANS